MSKISISTAKPESNVSALKVIKDVTGLSIDSVRSRLSDGKRGVFYTTELFLNDHKEKEAQIRKLISELSKLGIELFIMEVEHDENWADVHDFDSIRISTAELLNMLDENTDKFS
ncbi:hypothetical protein [Aliikangiella maris]|uniref:Uncharacterized protein n=2 Tax=Aliikangiella maris TaxID=3162458 RepID=A0ABV2BZT7_9GAMM